MYLPNKYTKWYNNIIQSAKSRIEVLGYTEKHHIIPKSLGGNNSKSNLVRLTAREHFICHLLLVKMTTGSDKIKMACAVYMFRHTRQETINSKIYEKVRALRSKYVSHIMTAHNPMQNTKSRAKCAQHGPKNGMFGKPGPLLGKTGSSHPCFGLKRPDRSEAMSGSGNYFYNKSYVISMNLRWYNDGTTNKYVPEGSQPPEFVPGRLPNPNFRSQLKGIPQPKITCPHCGKTGGQANMKRWHFDKCRSLNLDN